jgi:hypothetical protein
MSSATVVFQLIRLEVVVDDGVIDTLLDNTPIACQPAVSGVPDEGGCGTVTGMLLTINMFEESKPPPITV